MEDPLGKGRALRGARDACLIISQVTRRISEVFQCKNEELLSESQEAILQSLV